MNWLSYICRKITWVLCVHASISQESYFVHDSSGFSNKSQASTMGSRTLIKITFRDSNTSRLRSANSNPNLKYCSLEFFHFLSISVNIYSKFLEKSKLYNIRNRALNEHLSHLCLLLSSWLDICSKSFLFSPSHHLSLLSTFSANFQRLGCAFLFVWASL